MATDFVTQLEQSVGTLHRKCGLGLCDEVLDVSIIGSDTTRRVFCPAHATRADERRNVLSDLIAEIDWLLTSSDQPLPLMPTTPKPRRVTRANLRRWRLRLNYEYAVIPNRNQDPTTTESVNGQKPDANADTRPAHTTVQTPVNTPGQISGTTTASSQGHAVTAPEIGIPDRGPATRQRKRRQRATTLHLGPDNQPTLATSETFLRDLTREAPRVHRKCGLPTCDKHWRVEMFSNQEINEGFCRRPSEGVDHAQAAQNRRRTLETKMAEIDALLKKEEPFPKIHGLPKERRMTRANLRTWRRRLEWELEGIPVNANKANRPTQAHTAAPSNSR